MTVTPYPAQLCLALQHYTLHSYAWHCNTIPWTAMPGPATLYPRQPCLTATLYPGQPCMAQQHYTLDSYAWPFLRDSNKGM